MNNNIIYVIQSIVGNFFSRFLLSSLGYFEICKQQRVEVVLDLYTGKCMNVCLRCFLAESTLSIVCFNWQVFVVNREGKKRFRNPYLMGSFQSQDS